MIPRILTAVMVLVLASPASAMALDTFVDPDTGNDSNNCTQAAPGGAGVGPCATIGAAVLKAAASSGTVRIDRGDTYAEAVTLISGVSLLGQEIAPSDTGAAVIDPGAGRALTINAGQSAGRIEGLTLRGNDLGIFTLGTVAKISGNTFDDPTAASNGILLSGTSTTLVTANTFTGDGTSGQVAIDIGNGTPTIRENTISGYYGGITFGGSGGGTSAPTITSNTITGAHQSGSAGAAISGFSASDAVVVGNRVTSAGSGISIGISVNGFSDPSTTGVTLRRNHIDGGYFNGVDIRDTELPASLNGDLIAESTGSGVHLQDQNAIGTDGDATLTNATVWDNAQDVTTSANTLTLNSTLTQDPVSAISGATCAISFSRGPTTSGAACETFQTTADPLFVNAAGGDYHLQPGSTMIDQGNPAAPAAGILDLDGGARAIDATPHCSGNVNRRDIGADEFVPVPLDCAAPNTGARKPRIIPAKDKAIFKFRSTEPGSTFRCKLDSRPYIRCRSPKTYKSLSAGIHTFRVRATDAAGNTDRTPAKRKFTI